MADKDLNIILRLKDGLSAKLNKVNEDVGRMERNLQKTAQSMQRLGNAMLFLGGTITGSFGLALNTASKYSLEARDTMEKFQTAATQLQVTIATAVLPTFEKMAVVMGNVVRCFQQLDPKLRDTILNVGLLTGVLLTLGGTLLRIGSAILKLLAVLVAHPFVAIMTAGLFVLISHWKEWEGQIKKVLHALEIGMYMVGIGFQKVAKWMSDAMITLTTHMADYYRLLGRVMGPQQQLFLGAADGMEKVAGKMRVVSVNAQKTISDLEAAIADVLQYGNDHTDGFVDKMTTLLDSLKTIGSGDFTLEPLVQKFDHIRAIAQGTAQAMHTAFSDIFFKAFTNDLGNIKDTLRDFGRSILQMLSQVLAKMLLIRLFGNMSMGGVPFASFFHQGGVVRAHSGMNLANDEVPIIAQKGEGVISKRGMQALGSENFNKINSGSSMGGGGNVTISVPVIVQAWDVQDIHRNKRLLVNAVNEAIGRNDSIREIIRRTR